MNYITSFSSLSNIFHSSFFPLCFLIYMICPDFFLSLRIDDCRMQPTHLLSKKEYILNSLGCIPEKFSILLYCDAVRLVSACDIVVMHGRLSVMQLPVTDTELNCRKITIAVNADKGHRFYHHVYDAMLFHTRTPLPSSVFHQERIFRYHSKAPPWCIISKALQIGLQLLILLLQRTVTVAHHFTRINVVFHPSLLSVQKGFKHLQSIMVTCVIVQLPCVIELFSCVQLLPPVPVAFQKCRKVTVPESLICSF